MMIADFLKSEGVAVTHILDSKHSKEHEYTKCARIVDRKLTYHQQNYSKEAAHRGKSPTTSASQFVAKEFETSQ